MRRDLTYPTLATRDSAALQVPLPLEAALQAPTSAYAPEEKARRLTPLGGNDNANLERVLMF